MARGHEVRVITNRYPTALPAKETIDDVKVDRLVFLSSRMDYLSHGRPDLFAASVFYGPRSYAALEKLMRDFRPDVVNVHFPDHQIPFVLKLRSKFSFRLVVSLHGHDVERMNSAKSITTKAHETPKTKRETRNTKLGSVLKEADAITACSRNVLDQAIKIESSVIDKGHVIYNGVDFRRFANKGRYSHGRPYILAIGRLTYNKGFDMLLRAFAEARAVNATVDLIIAGEGEDREQLKSLANELRLDEQVHFFGAASPEQVVELLNGAEFVVVPSRHEAFGIVSLEALAAGKYVLATSTGGLAEFLSNISEKGVTLVDPSIDALACALRNLLSSPPNGSSSAPEIQSALEQYSWTNIAGCYEMVLLGSSQS